MLTATLVLAAAQPAMNRIVPSLPMPWASAGRLRDRAGAAEVETEVACRSAGRGASRRRPSSVGLVAVAYQVWAAGVTVSLAILLIGVAWLTWLTSRASTPARSGSSRGGRARGSLGIRRPVRVA